MFKKLFLSLFVLIVGIFAFYIFLKPNPKREAAKALACLKNHHFVEAEALINRMPDSWGNSLYKGYIEQIKGHFDLAEPHLRAAWNEAKNLKDLNNLAEISLAQASNAYMQGHYEACMEWIKTAQTYQPDHSALDFFKGLHAYLEKAYGEALQFWHLFSSEHLKGWLGFSTETLFSDQWRQLRMAHSFIEEGDVIQGRSLLEKESHLIDLQAENFPLIQLFLGYSYVKESRKVACIDRGSFYRLAHFYFERAHVLKDHEAELNRIIDHLEKETTMLLLSEKEEKKEAGLGFVHILQEWNAKESIGRLATIFTNFLLTHNEKENIYLCESVKEQFQGTFFHNFLNHAILEALALNLSQGESENLFYLWSLLEKLSSAPKEAAKQIATLAASEIFETIKIDDLMLTRTRNFMAFWESLGRNEFEREKMAWELLSHAKFFWYHEKQEKKGRRLMEIALKITNHDPIIAQEIEWFLSNLYVQAENSNMIRRLTLIYDAMGFFEIDCHALISKAAIANHLADAEYFFEAHNFFAARRHANWVLKLEPQNQGARRLAGLSSFHLKDYTKAICHIQMLLDSDIECQEAMLLSQIFSSCPLQSKHLCTSYLLKDR